MVTLSCPLTSNVRQFPLVILADEVIACCSFKFLYFDSRYFESIHFYSLFCRKASDFSCLSPPFINSSRGVCRCSGFSTHPVTALMLNLLHSSWSSRHVRLLHILAWLSLQSPCSRTIQLSYKKLHTKTSVLSKSAGLFRLHSFLGCL